MNSKLLVPLNICAISSLKNCVLDRPEIAMWLLIAYDKVDSDLLKNAVNFVWNANEKARQIQSFLFRACQKFGVPIEMCNLSLDQFALYFGKSHCVDGTCGQGLTGSISRIRGYCSNCFRESQENQVLEKEKTWKNQFGSSSRGICPCCDKPIERHQNAQFGHVEANVFLGQATAENGMYVCKTCNSAMGTRNLLVFKEELSRCRTFLRNVSYLEAVHKDWVKWMRELFSRNKGDIDALESKLVVIRLAYAAEAKARANPWDPVEVPKDPVKVPQKDLDTDSLTKGTPIPSQGRKRNNRRKPKARKGRGSGAPTGSQPKGVKRS